MSRTPAGYEIGRARADEIDRLPRIEVEAARILPVEDLSRELGAEGLSLSFLEACSGEGRLWVARAIEPPEPVGFAAVTLVDGSAHLHEIDVLPEHGRQGLGRALVLTVARWAAEAGFPSLTLTTFRHIPWNAPFYASLGFSEVSESAVGPELRRTLEDEAEAGLDPRKRLAMRLDLPAA